MRYFGHDNVAALLFFMVLPCSVFCVYLPTPVNLSMVSQNFIHLLSWEAGLGSPDGVIYMVKARSVSTDWETVKSCATVHFLLRCNLTEALSEPQDTYFINVSASLGNLTSQPAFFDSFQPFKHTILDPPLPNISLCNKSLCIQLQAPSERHLSVYKLLTYKLNITSSRKFKFSKEVHGLKDVVLEHLEPGKEYCVNISIRDHISANRPAVCALTPISGSNSVLDAVISVILLLVVLLLCVSTYLGLASGFFCLKVPLTSVLSSLQSPYNVSILSCPSDESIATISMEPSTTADVKGDREMDGESNCKKDKEVEYERQGAWTARSEETSHNSGSFSAPPSTDVQCEVPYEETCSSVVKNQISPVGLSKTLCLVPALIPQCRLGFEFQMKSKEPQATSQISAMEHLSEMKKNKDLTFLGHKNKDKEGQDGEVECITVNFLSLRLGACMDEEQWEIKEEENTVQMQEQVVPSSNTPLVVPEDPPVIQPTYSANTDKHITNSDEEEEEEEEDYSDYLKRS